MALYNEKSAQRKVRSLRFTVAAADATTTGLDKNQVSVVDTGTGVKTITFDKAFADAELSVQVTCGTADTTAQYAITSSSVLVVNSFDSTDGTTAKDAIINVVVTGSDITDRY